MRARLKQAVIVGLMLPAVAFGSLVFAQNPDTPTQSPDQQLPQPSNEDIQRRIQQRKDRNNQPITFVLRSQIQSRCASTQGSLKSIEGRLVGVKERRELAYEGTIDRLTSLSTELKDRNINVEDFDRNIQELTNQVEEFNSRIDKHIATLTDLAGMDCVADPEGYWVTLEEARSSRNLVIESVKEIKSYLQGTIKAELQNLKSQIDNASSDGGQEG